MAKKQKRRFVESAKDFNTIVITFGICGGLLLLIGCFAYEVFWPRQQYTQNVVNVDTQDTTLTTEYFLGDASYIKPAAFLVAPLNSEQSYAGSDFSLRSFKKSSGGNVVNYLFIDNSNFASTWLFKNNNQLILERKPFRATSENENNYYDISEATAFLYEVVKSDTNLNKRFDNQDLATIAVSSNNGQNYNELVSGVELISSGQTSATTFTIMYKKGNQNFIASFNIDGTPIGEETMLAAIPSTEPQTEEVK